MGKLLFTIIKTNLKTLKRRFLERREVALNRAYEAPLTIKAITNCNFHTSKIAADLTNHSSNLLAHLQAALKKYLNIAKLKLAEFKTSEAIVSIATQRYALVNVTSLSTDLFFYTVNTQHFITLEKLKLIGGILAR